MEPNHKPQYWQCNADPELFDLSDEDLKELEEAEATAADEEYDRRRDELIAEHSYMREA